MICDNCKDRLTCSFVNLHTRECKLYSPDTSSDRKTVEGKLEYTCFSWQAMEEVAKIFAEAKRKYGNSDSWRLSGPDAIPNYLNALLRHTIELLKGKPDVYTETIDGKTYTWRHSAQIVWNGLAICHKQLEKERQ